MKRYVTLDEAKRHLNIEPENTLDDDYITSLIEVAEEVVRGYGRLDLDELAEKKEGMLPPGVRHAILLMVGELYLHREASTDKKPCYDAFDRLMYLFINYER